MLLHGTLIFSIPVPLFASTILCPLSLFLWKTKASTQDANASPRSPTAASMKFRSFRSACQAYQYQISAGQIVSWDPNQSINAHGKWVRKTRRTVSKLRKFLPPYSSLRVDIWKLCFDKAYELLVHLKKSFWISTRRSEQERSILPKLLATFLKNAHFRSLSYHVPRKSLPVVGPFEASIYVCSIYRTIIMLNYV